MHDKINIVVDERSFEYRPENQSITGIIYWRLGPVEFPAGSWNDFVLTILSWWVTAIFKLLSNESSEEELLFMDGPFRLLATQLDNYFELKTFDRDEPIHTFQVAKNELHKAILEACEPLDLYCKLKEIKSSDYRNFAAYFNRLKNLRTTGAH